MLWRGCPSWLVTVINRPIGHQEVLHALHLTTAASDQIHEALLSSCIARRISSAGFRRTPGARTALHLHATNEPLAVTQLWLCVYDVLSAGLIDSRQAVARGAEARPHFSAGCRCSGSPSEGTSGGGAGL
jgi:hypothetical protein